MKDLFWIDLNQEIQHVCIDTYVYIMYYTYRYIRNSVLTVRIGNLKIVYNVHVYTAAVHLNV